MEDLLELARVTRRSTGIQMTDGQVNIVCDTCSVIYFASHFCAWTSPTDCLLFEISFLHLLAENGDHVPYTLHALFMAFGALFVFNVEVLTRILFSSSPFPYLVLARWISDITPKVTLALVTHFISRISKADILLASALIN
uniref:Ion_trans domain-containing protein n=1 Tax=Angiostrongylus cantonensis TaxID=6313 RepID=A0A0K0DCZ3_ANGCA